MRPTRTPHVRHAGDVPRAPASVAPPDTRGVAILLFVLVVARAFAVAAPGAWAWGIDLVRFVPPALGWGAWLVTAAALLPAVAMPLVRAVPARLPAPLLAMLAFAFGAALAASLPDRTSFLGDSLMRSGFVLDAFRRVFPQAMPLDTWLHGLLPATLGARSAEDVVRIARASGALESGLLAAASVAFARASGARGAVAAATWAAAFLGGHLAVFTGFGKGTSECALVVTAFAAASLSVLRGGRGRLAAGGAVALGILLHRSMVLLLPALAWLALLPRGGDRRGSALDAARTLALPVVTLLVLAPRLVRTFATFDVPHHVRGGAIGAAGGPLAAAFAPLHLLDLANAALLVAPLAPLALFALPRLRRGDPDADAAAWFALLVGAFAPMVCFAHPQQGVYRDWDVFVPAGLTLTLCAAWTFARLAARAGDAARLAPAIAAAAAMPTLLLLAIAAVPELGIARVVAYAEGPPERSDTERGLAYEFVGQRHLRNRDYAAAAEALRRSVELLPQVRALHEWALAAALGGHHHEAMRAAERLNERQPQNLFGWVVRVHSAAHLRQPDARDAALAGLRTQLARPGTAAELARLRVQFPELWPREADALLAPAP